LPELQVRAIFAAAGAVLVLVLALLAWLNDFVTLKGEWTIYTVDCREGEWRDSTCTGRLSAGPRYRFRALRAHREVLFWTVGAPSETSGKFTECQIRNGRTWSCPPGSDSTRTITTALEYGQPVHDGSGRTQPCHAVPKWRWLLLRSRSAIAAEFRRG
jgi:hypothetical protein